MMNESEQKVYYQISSEASSQISGNVALDQITQTAKESNLVLDVGCGDGTRIGLLKGNKKSYGIDINKFAIKSASKNHPHQIFQVYDGNTIPFGDDYFDFVYSAFVLEHVQNPQRFVDEMIRVVKSKATITVVCPNYGAPNRRSPVSLEKPVTKLLKGIARDIFQVYKSGLHFTQVTPKKTFKNIDDDTTQEPYILTLVNYLIKRGDVKLIRSSSMWEIDDNANSVHQSIFKLMGQMKIYPFWYWGPQLFIQIEKK